MHGRVPRSDVRDRLDPAAALDRAAAISAFIRARAIGLSLMSTKPTPPESASRCGDAEHRLVVAALRRVELDRDDPVALAQRRWRAGSRRSRGGGRGELALGEPGGTRGARRSSTARRIAAIWVGVVPQQPPMSARAQRARVGGELGEVLGRRVREDDPAAGEAGAGRGSAPREQRRRRRAICSSAASAACGPAPQFAPRPPRSSPREAHGSVSRGHARERLGVPSSNVSSATIGSDETDRTAAIAVTSSLEVVERLDDEQVDAAAVEELRLLGEQPRPSSSASPASPQRPDRPRRRTRRVPETSRASRAILTPPEFDAPRTRPRGSAPASLRRLAPNVFVSIRSAPARMKLRWSGDDALGRADVRLLGAAQARRPRSRAARPSRRRRRSTGPVASRSRKRLTPPRLSPESQPPPSTEFG